MDQYCPPRMSDGRTFTDYSSRCAYASAWRQRNLADKPMSSNAARQFLVDNADRIMQHNASVAMRTGGCGTCYGLGDEGTMLPEYEMTVCDKRTCTFPRTGAAHGIGMGRRSSA
jgi:hypothetical protein